MPSVGGNMYRAYMEFIFEDLIKVSCKDYV